MIPIGFIWFITVFAVLFGAGILLSKPRSWIPSFITSAIATAILYTQTLAQSVDYILFQPTLKAMEGGELTLFEWSGVSILASLILAGIFMTLNAIASWEENGTIEFWF